MFVTIFCLMVAGVSVVLAVVAIVREVRNYRREAARVHSVDELRAMLTEREARR